MVRFFVPVTIAPEFAFALRRTLSAVAQLGILWAFSFAGSRIANGLHLTLPGNVVGMALLFLALTFGVVREAWFASTVRFLTKHLTFFFIPLIVGVMDSGALLARSGLAIAVALVLSAAIGIGVTALVTDRLARRVRA